MKVLNKSQVDEFKNSLTGRVVLPGDNEYDELRKIWNAMIDRKPAIIVQCKNADDVVKTIQFARSNQLEISIRGGGHNIAGSALCNNGLVMDLSTMTKVLIDAEDQRAFAEPGALLSQFDEEAQKYGLATPLGVNSTTGIAGLTLGGGVGWITRKYGLTIDNLVSVEIITADGRKLTANETKNQDLFWAIRGGGGNFGVVTLFEFKLHKIGPEILTGLFVFPQEQVKQVLQRFYQFSSSAPEELTTLTVLRYAPPLPFLSEEVHGQKVIIVAASYFGDMDKGMELIQPVQSFGNILGKMVTPMQYIDLQKLFDPLMTSGDRNYWKTHNFIQLNDELLDKLEAYSDEFPTPQCEIFIADFGGALNRVERDATAFYHRDLKYVMNVHCRWQDASEDKRCIAWAREFFEASKPYASAGAYVNFMMEEGQDRIKASYGSNYKRLAKIKAKYDPDNFFHINQNIKPGKK